MKEKAENELRGILGYTEDNFVSIDFIQDPSPPSSTPRQASNPAPRFVKVVAWYDNEMGDTLTE